MMKSEDKIHKKVNLESSLPVFLCVLIAVRSRMVRRHRVARGIIGPATAGSLPGNRYVSRTGGGGDLMI